MIKLQYYLKFMITNADIKKLTEVFATREELDQKFASLTEVFYTKTEIDTRFDQVIKGIDNLTKLYLTDNHEVTAVGHRVDKLENWAGKVGAKVGIKLKH